MRNIKKAISIFLFVAVIVSLLFAASACGKRDAKTAESNYAMTAKVIAVSEVQDTVTVQDSTGNVWEFKDASDWEVNDCASLVMNGKGTESILDDEIVDARYNAWTLMQ